MQQVATEIQGFIEGSHGTVIKFDFHFELKFEVELQWDLDLLRMGEPGMRRSTSSYSHQPSVRPNVSVRNSVFVDSSLAISSPPLRSSALQCCRVFPMSRVACNTFVAKRTS